MSQGRKARLDHKEFLARLELRVPLAQPVLPEQLETLGLLDKLEQQARLAPLVRQELLVRLDQQARLELQARPGQLERFRRI